MRFTGLVLALSLFTAASFCDAQTVTTIPLATNHIVYDHVSGNIFATVPASNSIVAINPATGTVGSPIAIGSDPDVLAVSDDGQFLYVGLDGAPEIQRYDLHTETLGIDFGLGTDYADDPYYALDMVVLPGEPHTLVVSQGTLPRDGGQNAGAVYDDGSERANILFDTYGISSLAKSLSASQIYTSWGESISVLNVNPDGLSVSNSGVLAGASGNPHSLVSDPNTGFAYDYSGDTINPATMSPVGTYDTGLISGSPAVQTMGIFPDTANHRVFALTTGVNGDESSFLVEEYNSDTFLPIGALVIPATLNNYFNSAYGYDLIGYGTNGLAFSSVFGNVYLINGRTFPGLASVSVNQASVAGGTAVNATVTLTQPAPVGGAVVYLSEMGTGVTMPSTVTVPAGQTSVSAALQTTTVMSTSAIKIEAKYGVQVVETSFDILDSNLDNPYTPNISLINQPNSDIAYNSVNGRLYISVPSLNGTTGNSIFSIDPNTGQLGGQTFIGSEPGPIAISSDGSYVWAGLDGAASIGRVDLTTATQDQMFTLAANNGPGDVYASHIVGIPDQPHAMVVSYDMSTNPLDPDYEGMAVYDDDIERPISLGWPQGGDPIVIDSTGSTIYTINAASEQFDTIGLNASGVSLLNTASPLFSLGGNISYDLGLIYDGDGQVANAGSATLVGDFSVRNPPNPNPFVLPDVTNSVVYFISSTGSLQAFDPITYLQLYSLAIPGVSGNIKDAVLCSPGKIAFDTSDGQIFIVNMNQAPVLTQTATLQPGLQMFSVPYDFSVGSQTLSQTLGGLVNPKLAVWQPGSSAYAVTPTPPASTLVVGQGYWARFPQSVNLIGPHAVTPSGPFSIALTKGWNMIGDPFAHSVSIGAITVTPANSTTAISYATATSGQIPILDPWFYSYPADSTEYVPNGATDNLEPYLGYWVYVSEGCTLNLQ